MIAPHTTEPDGGMPDLTTLHEAPQPALCAYPQASSAKLPYHAPHIPLAFDFIHSSCFN